MYISGVSYESERRAEMKHPDKDTEKEAFHADESIDLRGRICPLTFVYTKLALEKLSRGKVLEVTLDYPPAFANVPRSIKIQKLGRVIGEKQDGKVKTLWIKK
jgi:TusA-related sulfurtransferase